MLSDSLAVVIGVQFASAADHGDGRSSGSLPCATTNIEVSRSVVRSAERDLQWAHGFYDEIEIQPPLLSRSAPGEQLDSGWRYGIDYRQRQHGRLSLFGLSPKAGGQYEFAYNDSQTQTNVIFATLDKQFKTNLTFSYKQPLLRNREIDEPRRQIEIARKNLSLTDAEFRLSVIDTITRVRNLYWETVYALRNLQIQQDALRAAEEQLSHTRRLVGRGYVAPIM